MVNQAKRVFPDGSHCRIETEKGPVAARHGKVLLQHAMSHVDAVCDAVAIGKDQRRTVIDFCFAEDLERVLRVGAHRDLRDIDIAVGDRLQRQILAGDTLAASRELRDCADRCRLRHLAPGIRVNFGIQHEEVDVPTRREDMIESTIPDVVGPAVTPDDPDAAPDQMIDHRRKFARCLAVDL